jgi:hypothetical protein
MHYKYIGVVYPISERAGSFGLAYNYLSTGESIAVDEYGNPIGTFATYDYAISVSYGVSFRDIVGVGLTAKYIYSFMFPPEIVQEVLGLPAGEDYSFGFDAGLLLKTPKIPCVSVGIALQNFGNRLFDSPLPRVLRRGFCFEPIYLIDEVVGKENGYKMSNIVNFTYTKDWITCLEKDITENSNETWEASGWEITFGRVLSFRRGEFVDRIGARVGKTNGVGLKLGFLDFEMADDSDIYSFPTENLRVQLNIHETRIPPFLEESSYRKITPVLASLVIPGAGHLLEGKKETGSILLVSSIVLGCVTWELKDNEDNLFYIPLTGLLGLYGYSIWDLL